MGGWSDAPPRGPLLRGAERGPDRLRHGGAGRALLVPPAWISHLELLWQDPAYRAFFTPLAGARTVVQYDRPGAGCPNRGPGLRDWTRDLAVLEAVADQLGLERFDLLGISLAAPVSVAFAARFPHRVGRLILYGGYADGAGSPPPRSAPRCWT